MNGQVRILRLTQGGLPSRWVSREEAAILYSKERVLWSLGDDEFCMLGGFNCHGQRSYLMLAPIIACTGETCNHSFVPSLNNRFLFRRDDYRCLYCGDEYHRHELTRDHVVPRVQGGSDCWTNVVTACRRCNQRKGGRTPEQAHMPLLAIPFEPNLFEWMYLANRHIRGDQMEYLQGRFSKKRRWLAA